MTDKWYEDGLPHVWLPYCQMQVAPPPLPVVGAHGCRIVLADGRELIDGIASWWCMCHGYNHPHILDRVARQLGTMPHVMFGGLAHEQALVLASRLTAMAPSGLSRVFFTDSGSIAVEVALKIALQYWRNTGRTGKDRFLETVARKGSHFERSRVRCRLSAVDRRPAACRSRCRSRASRPTKFARVRTR
jgi:adenosylmethionine---8-amino-7-oxononanoate aminotransferase